MCMCVNTEATNKTEHVIHNERKIHTCHTHTYNNLHQMNIKLMNFGVSACQVSHSSWVPPTARIAKGLFLTLWFKFLKYSEHFIKKNPL